MAFFNVILTFAAVLSFSAIIGMILEHGNDDFFIPARKVFLISVGFMVVVIVSKFIAGFYLQ